METHLQDKSKATEINAIAYGNGREWKEEVGCQGGGGPGGGRGGGGVREWEMSLFWRSNDFPIPFHVSDIDIYTRIHKDKHTFIDLLIHTHLHLQTHTYILAYLISIYFSFVLFSLLHPPPLLPRASHPFHTCKDATFSLRINHLSRERLV